MVSKAALNRMFEDVLSLERRHGTGVACIFVRYLSTMDKNAVIERHYSLFPDERDAEVIVTTCLEMRDGEEMPANSYTGKGDQAWRSLARERINHV